MRLFPMVIGVMMLAGLLVPTCSTADAATTVRGLFGERTLGGPVAPRARTRFDSGLQRGPSGNFLGLDRNQRFTRERPTLRSAIPDDPRSITGLPPVVPQQFAPYGSRRYVVPTRPVPPPRIQPVRPADTWFRTRGPRDR